MFSVRQNIVSNITGTEENDIRACRKGYQADLLRGHTYLHETNQVKKKKEKTMSQPVVHLDSCNFVFMYLVS